MTTLLLIVSVWLLGASVYNLFFVIFSLRMFNREVKKNQNLVSRNNINFIVVVPVYIEQNIINETVEFFKSLEYEGNYKIVFISSGREDIDLEKIKLVYSKNEFYNYKEVKDLLGKYINDADLGLSLSLFIKKYFDNSGKIKIKTTGDILDGLVDGERLLHFKTDGSDRVKADQINQFLVKMSSIIDNYHDFDNENTYISIYDCDSRTDRGILSIASKYINFYKSRSNKFPAGLQQTPLYISNFNLIKSQIAKYRFVYDLYFHFAVEFPTMFAKTKQANAIVAALCTRLIHGIGHGEFFNFYILKKLGYFQPPNGDTDYGYSLCYVSEDFLPLPIFDISETPNKTRILIKRGVVWFNGVFLFNKNRKIIERILGKNLLSLNNFLMILRLTISNIYWMIGPLLIVCSMIISLLLRWYDLSFFLVLGIILNSLPAIIVANFARNNFRSIFSIKDVILSFVFYPAEKVIHSLGPLLWLYLKLVNIDLKDLGRLKTKRI